MGVKERKERDKVEMRDKILQSAQHLFLAKGFDQISIRNIAEAIEYSPATIYLYFKDKNEIIHALHLDGFRLLVRHFEPLVKFTDPFERLIEMGNAYIKFATNNPGVYELLFVRTEPMKHITNRLDEEWKEGDRAFDVLFQTVSQCQQSGHFKGLDTQNLSMMIWSFIHGLCSLGISNHITHVKEARDKKLVVDAVMASTYQTFQTVMERLKA
ncbi:MAG: TetR/AcrR family transcriptional regulator [Cytophagales bacterium]|nr:TetR/AcrR family transcriptional regulator [Cytophagales bacterium]MCA6366754.1 TetR/AcrR family transcriptional regulator [Cytophagales bacterium]MCA6372767.1 TetR/AcrR family transcriptional regulator [Cytophagales bacterium]MCA6377623.1 TetR/AcrR family transcriptional regulator [Cytophagales bacterium]MCA6384790.1 TetR/AcrR family transcriptional regulator [Cytophagales bacterium]